MPKVVKIGKCNVLCWTPSESARWPNVSLGKNCRIRTNNLLKKDPRLNQFINEKTMGALDNYAEHENMNIYIAPLENDMFNDLVVSVFKDNNKEAYFPINVAKTKEEVPLFFRELYSKIHKATHPSASVESKIAPKTKHTKWGDFKMYIENVIDRFNDARFELTQKIIKNFD